jgi:hypothetical protein
MINLIKDKVSVFSSFEMPLVNEYDRMVLDDIELKVEYVNGVVVSYKEKDGVIYIFDIEIKDEQCKTINQQ